MQQLPTLKRKNIFWQRNSDFLHFESCFKYNFLLSYMNAGIFRQIIRFFSFLNATHDSRNIRQVPVAFFLHTFEEVAVWTAFLSSSFKLFHSQLTPYFLPRDQGPVSFKKSNQIHIMRLQFPFLTCFDSSLLNATVKPQRETLEWDPNFERLIK